MHFFPLPATVLFSQPSSCSCLTTVSSWDQSFPSAPAAMPVSLLTHWELNSSTYWLVSSPLSCIWGAFCIQIAVCSFRLLRTGQRLCGVSLSFRVPRTLSTWKMAVIWSRREHGLFNSGRNNRCAFRPGETCSQSRMQINSVDKEKY